MIRIFDVIFVLAGAIAFAYCLLMLFRPGLVEDWAVWIVAWRNDKPPRSGDYRFAWSVLTYSIPVALLFIVRILIGLGTEFVRRR
jgi:hypothetical protein